MKHLPKEACSAIVPIRKGARIRKRNRPADDHVIRAAHAVKEFIAKVTESPQEDCNTKRHDLALLLAIAFKSLPARNLRLLISTLDEDRDFELRCAEVEILKAEHELERCRITRREILEGVDLWWESESICPLVKANNALWETYRARLLELAEIPAPTRSHLARKKHLIGSLWLRPVMGGDGNGYYARLRAAVACDENRLPRERRARKAT